ncbi:Zn-dependent exopeptidase [Pisolithus orientalis]|uniref:Zn-dependent exopeptidase n=1 Tax=Pisolithus orientalis TaxID=936130 RepID=UPI00222450E2|nr:Zn-dependent exopeptidase [Pisolithus orientalis]KAI6035044.1 Zn-dependent exopeptidase [Pisolithus orientalis]
MGLLANSPPVIDKKEKGVFNPADHDLEEPTAVDKQVRPACFRRVLGIAAASLLLLSGIFASHHSVLLNRGCKGAHKHPRSGYTARIERTFLSVPSTASALNYSRHYATHPHLAGSVEDFQDAKDVLSFFQRELGISAPSTEPIFDAGSPKSRQATLSTTSTLDHPSAWMDVYYPVLNTGNADGISLAILDSDNQPIWTADLLEDGDPGDETAAKYKNAIPPWHGLSAAGEAIGQLVYANYGTRDDYEKLVEAGVDLTGKVILARYGGNFRGLKIQGAEQHGVAGVIMYSDPRDDGSVTVENGYLPYPNGPARNPTSIQRGSVTFLSTYPGDPTTPGFPAYPNVTRTDPSCLPSIPSIPLSWANARVLFEQELGGIEEGRKLNGRVGGHLIKLTNDVDNQVTPIWNTMAAIPGRIKDEVVILGCHRDAWVTGGADPISGTVSLLEVVRGLGALIQQGWQPLRTILLASWDAEEHGLVGSTEFGEDFAEWIQAHAVSYINVDVSVSGSRWNVAGSPSLAHLIKRSAQDVPHPTQANKTLWDARYDSGPYTGVQDAEFAEMWTRNNKVYENVDDSTVSVSPLGSGSDYTVFLQRLGIASSDQGFGYTPTDAVYHYHSIYDSQAWQERYGDPGFHRHVAVAKNLGLIMLRLADSVVLPLNTTQYAVELDSYVDLVEESAPNRDVLPKLDKLRKAISKLQKSSLKLDMEKAEAEKEFRRAVRRIIRGRWGSHTIKRICNWIKYLLGYSLKNSSEVGRHADMKHVWDIVGNFEQQGDVCRQRHKGSICNLIKAVAKVRKVNHKLRTFEQGFLSEGGIKDREWFKHLGVAPGRYLGYGATTLPALSEAVVYDRNATLAEHEAARLTRLIKVLAKQLNV